MKLVYHVLIFVMALFICGCSSVMRQSHFAPCTEAQCGKCRGTGSYRCQQCEGRGSIPCRGCKGVGLITCFSCGGDGILSTGAKCGCVLTGHRGRETCSACSGTTRESCSECDSKGMVPCGITTYDWVCRKCGARFDFPPEGCPKCGAK